MTETLVQELINRSPLSAPVGQKPWPQWARYLFFIAFTFALAGTILATYAILPATHFVLIRMFRHRVLPSRKPRRMFTANRGYLMEYLPEGGVMWMPDRYHGGYGGLWVSQVRPDLQTYGSGEEICFISLN